MQLVEERLKILWQYIFFLIIQCEVDLLKIVFTKNKNTSGQIYTFGDIIHKCQGPNCIEILFLKRHHFKIHTFDQWQYRQYLEFSHNFVVEGRQLIFTFNKNARKRAACISYYFQGLHLRFQLPSSRLGSFALHRKSRKLVANRVKYIFLTAKDFLLWHIDFSRS